MGNDEWQDNSGESHFGVFKPLKRKRRSIISGDENGGNIAFTSCGEEEEVVNQPEAIYAPSGDYGKYHVQGHGYYEKAKDENGKQKRVRIGDLVYIKESRQNVETQAITLVLRFWFNNRWNEIEVNRKQLQHNELPKLLEQGLDVHNHKVRQLVQFLDVQEKEASVIYQHKHLGWEVQGKSMVFKHVQVIGEQVSAPSSYGGELSLVSGTMAGWQDVIDKEVMGHIPLEAVLTWSFVSPLVSLFAKEQDMEVLIFHLFGDSSKGKTTAARLFVSTFGKPTRKEGGMILYWKGTQNAIVG